ncbi:LOG family protein [Phycisphaerales bacterium AB-hyl4]|uniref:AMP nucleosidase n=1 Tax=Natronomicrosphaera hydrolytica TaxID=3242702 RepID=A0ABV4U4W3_9BACT
MSNTPTNAPRSSGNDPLAELDQLIRDTGGDPTTEAGMRIRELMHTVIKLQRDGADLGEIKLVSRSFKELRYAMKVFRTYRDERKVSVFGSARTKEDDPCYQAAVEYSRQMAGAGWMVITGAGDGIMRAGHGGAGREASFGVAIRLPFETNANDYIVGDPKLITFRYFFTRKLMFMWHSHAIALFPGGFGTHDEGFEALTLIQTGKAPVLPIVMIDKPGGTYWKEWDQYVRRQLLANGMISEQDLSFYLVTDDPAEACQYVTQFYRNYHSQRFVQDLLVLRIMRPLTDGQIEKLNAEFAILLAAGRIEQGSALDVEEDHLDLTRLYFQSTRRDYGHLRQLIDRINQFDQINHPTLTNEQPTQPPTNDLADQTSDSAK